MRYVVWVLGLVLFLLVAGFAVKNSASATVYYYLGYQWQAPLVLVILVFFSAGVVLGLLASLAAVFRQRREILALKRELRLKHQTADSAQLGAAQKT